MKTLYQTGLIKKYYWLVLVLFLALPSNGNSQIQVGTGTFVDRSLPIDPYFGYSYSQTIYLASEIQSDGGRITSLEWYFDG
jgi:hypothetical protein